MKIFIFLSVVALVNAKCSSDDALKCNTIEKELEDGKWPQNADEVKSLCAKLFAGGKCIREFADNCLRPKFVFLINAILDREKKVLENICGPGVDQFLCDIKKCFNKSQIINGLKDTHKRYVDLVEAAKNFAPSTYDQSICCTQLYNYDSIYALNSDKCNKEIADRLKDLAKNTFGDIFYQMCGDVNSYEACYSKLPGDIQKAFKPITDASTAPEPKHKYALTTLLEMFVNLF